MLQAEANIEEDRSYHAVWATRSAPHLAYAVLPKCACSSIGQVIHWLDHGDFYRDGLVHDVGAPILKGADEATRAEIGRIAKSASVTRFSFVRNPYRRLLSAFADKIWSFQLNGRRYRLGAIHTALSAYGMRWGPNARIDENVRLFVKFVAECIETGQPMDIDPHFAGQFKLLRKKLRQTPAWRFDFLGRVETFRDDVPRLLAESGRRFCAQDMPRENPSSLPAMPIDAFFGPAERQIMARVFAEDFDLFGYSRDPGSSEVSGTIDVEAVNHAMRADP